MYEVECSITADTEATAQNLPTQIREDGKAYYHLDHVIELSFGLTEYEARICWQENVSYPFEHVSDDIEPFTGSREKVRRLCRFSSILTRESYRGPATMIYSCD
jgi:hypothetical protein